MTKSPNSTKSADPFADWRVLHELATGHNRIGEYELAEEYAAAGGEEYLAAKARAAAQPEAPTPRQRKPRQPGKPRRPSIKQMVEGAEKAGKPLASITLPDGTKLDFSKPEPAEPENPWPLDEFRTKETKQ